MVVEGGSRPLLFRGVLEFLPELSFEVFPEGGHVVMYGV